MRARWKIKWEDRPIKRTFATCSKCGKEEIFTGDLGYADLPNFCAECGRPTNDKAVKIMGQWMREEHMDYRIEVRKAYEDMQRADRDREKAEMAYNAARTRYEKYQELISDAERQDVCES